MECLLYRIVIGRVRGKVYELCTCELLNLVSRTYYSIRTTFHFNYLTYFIIMMNSAVIHHNLASGKLIREWTVWIELWCLGTEVRLVKADDLDADTYHLIPQKMNKSLLVDSTLKDVQCYDPIAVQSWENRIFLALEKGCPHHTRTSHCGPAPCPLSCMIIHASLIQKYQLSWIGNAILS
jgi:hypothetical protein